MSRLSHRLLSGRGSAFKVALGLAVVVASFLATRAAVDAHSQSTYYTYRKYPADHTTPFFYHSSVPSSAKPRITDGANVWNGVPNTRHAFRADVAPVDDNSTDGNICHTPAIEAGVGSVYWQVTDGAGGSNLASTQLCGSSSRGIKAFRMTIDSGESFYTEREPSRPASMICSPSPIMSWVMRRVGRSTSTSPSSEPRPSA